MRQLPRNVHLSLHLLGVALALAGIVGLPSAVAPWVCMASHGAGAWTHRPESNPKGDTEFLSIFRTSLAVVACLISAGQHWVVGATGPEYLALAASSIVLEWMRPSPDKSA
ncbi:MAG: hypothetical protein VYA72_04750 [Bacteroidota bacterium]|nr:hypothetical protein [Bacteroidota bacterium]